MKQKGVKYSKLIFYNIFIIILSVCCITIAFFSFFNFYIYRNSFLDIIKDYDLSFLKQIEKSIETMNSITSSIAVSIFHDVNAQKLLFGNTSEIELISIFTSINNRIIPYPLIHSVYLYDGIGNIVYVFGYANRIQKVDEFYDRQALDYITNYEELNTLEPIPRRIPDLYQPDKKSHDVYSYIILEKDFK